MTELTITEVRAAAHRLTTLADALHDGLAPALTQLPLPTTAFGLLTEVHRWYGEALDAVTAAGTHARESLADAGADLAAFAARHTELDEQAAAVARRDDA
jgi:hypothetical protein